MGKVFPCRFRVRTTTATSEFDCRRRMSRSNELVEKVCLIVDKRFVKAVFIGHARRFRFSIFIYSSNKEPSLNFFQLSSNVVVASLPVLLVSRLSAVSVLPQDCKAAVSSGSTDNSLAELAFCRGNGAGFSTLLPNERNSIPKRASILPRPRLYEFFGVTDSGQECETYNPSSNFSPFVARSSFYPFISSTTRSIALSLALRTKNYTTLVHPEEARSAKIYRR